MLCLRAFMSIWQVPEEWPYKDAREFFTEPEVTPVEVGDRDCVCDMVVWYDMRSA